MIEGAVAWQVTNPGSHRAAKGMAGLGPERRDKLILSAEFGPANTLGANPGRGILTGFRRLSCVRVHKVTVPSKAEKNLFSLGEMLV